MWASREPRQALDHSGQGNGGDGGGWGRLRNRPGFPNAYSQCEPGTKGRSAGVRGGVREPYACVNASEMCA